MDKVAGKKELHADMFNLLTAGGYDVMLLPIVLRSAGILFKCLERAKEEMAIPNEREKTLYCSIYTLHTQEDLVSTGNT